MAFASGVFSLVSGNPVVTGTTISSTWANNTLSDIAANGLSLCVLKDGSQTITANIPMNSFKFTGLAAGSANGDSVRYQQFFPTFNTTGPVNETKTTVASATTPDIWTSVGNVVDYTGTTTATGFAAAPQAGSRRVLVCAAAASFTAGANVLIQGYASGSTYTAAAGDLVQVVAITTTQFRLTIQLASGAPIVGTSIPRSYLSGLTMSTAGSSATMSIAAGQATDSTNAVVMNLASAISKTTSSWAVGTGNGGLDTGSIANSTWYKFYEIMRQDTGVVDVIFTIAALATGPAMPSGYTYFRYIGSGKTNGSAQWTSFIQDGDLFQWLAPVLGDISAINPGTAAVSRTLTVPTGVNVEALVTVGVLVNEGSTISHSFFSDLAITDTAASTTFSDTPAVNVATSNTYGNVGHIRVRTNTSSQIRSRITASDGNITLTVNTLGWVDTRGRNS